MLYTICFCPNKSLLGCRSWQFLNLNNTDERPNKNKSKQKQSLSHPARRELILTWAKWKRKRGRKKREKCFSSCTLMAAVAWKQKVSTQGKLPGLQRAGVLRDLLTWEWRHCDPGGASGLTANRDQVNVLGAGQTGHVFHHTWSAFCLFFVL